jgi:hypothetical protein
MLVAPPLSPSIIGRTADDRLPGGCNDATHPWHVLRHRPLPNCLRYRPWPDAPRRMPHLLRVDLVSKMRILRPQDCLRVRHVWRRRRVLLEFCVWQSINVRVRIEPRARQQGEGGSLNRRWALREPPADSLSQHSPNSCLCMSNAKQRSTGHHVQIVHATERSPPQCISGRAGHQLLPRAFSAPQISLWAMHALQHSDAVGRWKPGFPRPHTTAPSPA